ncbi:MAG: c-type cytochrome, partial [Planctomycetaceae bacterium]
DGRLLYGTNHGGFRLLHALPGAYYWKSFGKHGPLHNPYAYGHFDHAPHENFTGGHVTVGGIVYQGDGLPKKYRDQYLFADTLGHQLFWDHIEPRASTVKTSFGGELAVANDTWFAPCDVATGPDGAIYFCDWHDARMAHPDPDADWDRRNGRIYRLAAKSSAPAAGPLAPAAGERVRVRGLSQPLDKLATPQLIALHQHPNNWIVRRARRILTERRDPEALLPLETLASTSTDDQLALEAFWTFASDGGLTDKTAPAFLRHRNPHIRRWTVQFLGDEPVLSTALADQLAQLAQTEPDVEVRTLLACTARRLPARQALPILQQLLLRDEDRQDPCQPLLLWWGIEQHSLAARRQIMDWLCSRAAEDSLLVHQAIVPRLIRRYASEGTQVGLESCGEILGVKQYAAERQPLLTAFEQGLGERAEPINLAWDQLPDQLRGVLEACWTTDVTDSALLRIGLRFHFAPAAQRTQALIADTSVATDVRLQAMKNLAELAGDSAIDSLLPILEDSASTEQLRLTAIDGLQRFRDDRIRITFLDLYSGTAGSLSPHIARALLSRPDWATAFLHEFQTGHFPVKNLKAEDWQTVITDLPESAREQIVKTWGSVAPPTAEERLAEIRRLNNDLRAASGNPAAGKQLFAQYCALCHKLHGEGNNVGPDLTHVNRKDRDYLLTQLVDPNAIIRKEYLAYSVSTHDGRVSTGLLVDQNAAELTLMAAKEQKTTIPLADVEEIRESNASLMPENVLKQLKPQELRDLFHYLQQPP